MTNLVGLQFRGSTIIGMFDNGTQASGLTINAVIPFLKETRSDHIVLDLPCNDDEKANTNINGICRSVPFTWRKIACKEIGPALVRL